MFEIDDVIVYGTQGVCRIVGLEEKAVGGVKKRYYVLKPIHDGGSTIYAPTDNELVRKKMRRLLSEAQINRLIDSMPEEDGVWLANDNDRKEHYRSILAGGDPGKLIQTIKAVYARKKAREAEGKRLHMMDEQFFKNAEQLLYREFQYVLKLQNKDAVMAYIVARIENSDKSI